MSVYQDSTVVGEPGARTTIAPRGVFMKNESLRSYYYEVYVLTLGEVHMTSLIILLSTMTSLTLLLGRY